MIKLKAQLFIEKSPNNMMTSQIKEYYGQPSLWDFFYFVENI